MRAAISELSSSDRIAAEALELGLVLPPGTPRFLDARGADARKALSSMTTPGEGIVTMTETTPVTTTTSVTPTLAATSVAPTPETTPSSDAAAPATPVDQTAVPETTATTTAAPPAEQPAQTQTPVAPEQEQAAQPAATTGGVDASGQVG
jgi:hypothetical protein